MDTASSWFAGGRRGAVRNGSATATRLARMTCEDRVPVDGGGRLLDGVPEAFEYAGDVHRRGRATSGSIAAPDHAWVVTATRRRPGSAPELARERS